MTITELFSKKSPTLSFEVFPPKSGANFDTVTEATHEIAKLKPDFMSVTYGAGGGTSEYTAAIAKDILDRYSVTPLAHLTCVSSTKEKAISEIKKLQSLGIENILALRGDIPADAPSRDEWDYHYACELIADIKETAPGMCVGGACYPEGHIERTSYTDDIKNLKTKVDAGCDFLTTQMFFDNNIFYNFLYKIRSAGIEVPVVAGIMPVANLRNVKRSCELSGTELPYRFKQILDRFGSDPAALRQAGIAYATEQIIDLIANGVNHIHIYTMNKPDVAAAIKNGLSEIIK
ncbi:MAG: methylenetetrahydrofolate reductase [Clostridia bacterium]|jgi:methylenetetrahydrofolate reductase (NADPH)|nr:methylenetetrahydrofolate reductase [NAD(P)H] [Clostridia bacterium]MBQ4243740.1 methylenetetrahydrofolate reductase [NAD(P)H] [Clostridia bacterium]